LFALMFKHIYVPEAFGKGIIIPIVKDKNGDLQSSENYRPITLSSMISKVFELYLLEKFSNYLDTDLFQFGFKKKLGCRNALFAPRCVLQYYNQRGSNVYIASLDATKAFDRVNHYTMFTILYRRGLPAVFVNLLINWYNKLSAQVRWNGLMSRVFCIKSGVRQGGILSPSLFNVYVNSILVTLRLNGLGCYIKKCYVGCLMYADDLLLMSASVVQLQRMLDVCGRIGNDLGIQFNSKKSCCMIVGPNLTIGPASITLNGGTIAWVDKFKYLGVIILSRSKFSVDLADTRRRFFIASNYILSHCSFATDLVKLELMEKHCLPILLYCMEVLNLSTVQIKDINAWWNCVIC